MANVERRKIIIPSVAATRSFLGPFFFLIDSSVFSSRILTSSLKWICRTIYVRYAVVRSTAIIVIMPLRYVPLKTQHTKRAWNINGETNQWKKKRNFLSWYHTHTQPKTSHTERVEVPLLVFLISGQMQLTNFSRGKEKQKRTVAFLYTFFLFYAMLIYISYFCLGFDGYRGH